MIFTTVAEIRYKNIYIGETCCQECNDEIDFNRWPNILFCYWLDEKTHESIPSEDLPHVIKMLEFFRINIKKIKTADDWFAFIKNDIDNFSFVIRRK